MRDLHLIPIVLSMTSCGGEDPWADAADLQEEVIDLRPTQPPPPNGPDSDGDLLSDEDEASLGTDPDDPDSDDDGYNDGYEVFDHTDPLDPLDRPYAGGWQIGACRHDIEATGNEIGQIAEDFVLTDQHGEDLRLHDFCDREVLLVTAALWCGPCQAEAPVLEEWFAEYDRRGFIVITMIGEDARGEPPGPEDATAWAEDHALTYPVVADPRWQITVRYTGLGSVLLPTMHQLGPGMEILQLDTLLDEGDIEAALP
ncbi:MAG TPA: TlpA family protein disulfide reductase [Deltaproteobacteria bacterium]|nr:TlpA family protein disulfide reductase [Deltaproteobacteria bacterium]